jgi:hypothetical protein
LLIGQALLARGDLPPCKSWGVRGDIAKTAGALGMERTAIAAAEAPIEKAVRSYLSAMPCLWIGIDDEPGPGSLRGVIERSAIALLSNFGREPLDPASPSWLGRFSDREPVTGSGLWNQRHVEEAHDSAFLNVFESLTDQRDVGGYRVL